MKSKDDTAFAFEALELLSARFRVFSDPMRLRILLDLGDRELAVSEIAKRTATSQANASRQLVVLLDAGLVARRKDGLRVYYRVADPTVFALCERVCRSIEETAPSSLDSSPSASGATEGCADPNGSDLDSPSGADPATRSKRAWLRGTDPVNRLSVSSKALSYTARRDARKGEIIGSTGGAVGRRER